jgi:hypothetical protein
LALLVVVFVFAAGCSYFYDAWIVNPCPDPIRIEPFSYSSRAYSQGIAEGVKDDPFRSVTIPASSKKKVEGAFSAGGREEWSVRIVGWRELVDVNGDEWDDNTVFLPESVCETDYHPSANP